MAHKCDCDSSGGGGGTAAMAQKKWAGAGKTAAMGKAHIPKAVREQCWLAAFGRTFDHACYIPWCANTITVFDFHVGHDTPESQGGTLDPRNLRPICARCNQSMGASYTIREWARLGRPRRRRRWWCGPRAAHGASA